MRAGFVTCVQLGLSCMETIYQTGYRLEVAFTLHDQLAQNKSGRVWIDEFCKEHELPLLKVRHIDDEAFLQSVIAYNLDWLFVIGWSQIAGRSVLSAPKHGVLGMHPTLLPVGRGRASIPWAILRGLDQTGVSLFRLNEGVDTGPILLQEVIPIVNGETATTLYEKIKMAHVSLIQSILPNLYAGTFSLNDQDESSATYWPGRTPEDGLIHSSMSATEIDRLVRASTHPYPGAFIQHPNGHTIIWAGSLHFAHNSLPIKSADDVYWATCYEFKAIKGSHTS